VLGDPAQAIYQFGARKAPGDEANGLTTGSSQGALWPKI